MTKVWNSLWKDYQKTPSTTIMNEMGGMLLRSEFIGLLLKYFDLKGKSVLDVGTGTGQYCIELSLRGAKCVGIDKDRESIKLAEKISRDYQAKNCTFEKRDLYDFKRTDFDMVINMGLLEHFDDSKIIDMLKKMKRLGKYIVVGVPYSGSDIYNLSKLYSQKKKTWEYGFEREFLTLKELFEKAGLTLHHEQVIGLGSEAYYLKRINKELITMQFSQSLTKSFNRTDNVGSWLVAIGSERKIHDHYRLEEKIPKEGVTIIIPVYNGEKYIERSVENLRKLDDQNVEIIYINDCSTDNTEKMLQKELYSLPNSSLINLKSNSGEVKARYEGLNRAENDYIFFLDIDDMIFPGCIRKIMRDMKNCPENTYLSNSCALMVNGKFTGDIWPHWYLRSPYDYILSELYTLSGKISLGNTIIKKSSLLEAYRLQDILYGEIGIKRMNVAPDTLLLDIMVFSKLIKNIIPIYYTYHAYELGIDSASQQMDNRINDIPIQVAYCFMWISKIPGVNERELENRIIYRAIKTYGNTLGTKFIDNFRKYRKMLQ